MPSLNTQRLPVSFMMFMIIFKVISKIGIRRLFEQDGGEHMVTTNDSLQVTQFIRGESKKVFLAWTDAELVSKWLCPEECRVISNEGDVRVAGKFRESMQCGDDIYTVYGDYREVVPGTKLVFTHQWDEPGSIETVVTVDLSEKNGGTEVTLVQKGFANAATAKGHEEGWASALRNLARLFP
jgi:uncharacterized protein YndB with AHSA1/START domain